MVLTEEKLRELYKQEKFKTYVLEKGMILTPSARQFFTDKGIELIKENAKIKAAPREEKVKEIQKERIIEVEKKPKYKGIGGETYFEKPEHMTQLKGNILVRKDDPRIVFRGKLDTFLSLWLVAQKEFEEYELEKLNADMESVSVLIKEMVRAEVLDLKLEHLQVLGENLDTIKEMSHNPKKYFGTGHLFGISNKNPLLVLKLNALRAQVRELEILGVKAFIDERNRIDHPEILLALNRLSSAIYLIMLKGETEKY